MIVCRGNAQFYESAAKACGAVHLLDIRCRIPCDDHSVALRKGYSHMDHDYQYVNCFADYILVPA